MSNNEYEKLRLENIRKNQEMLASLGLENVSKAARNRLKKLNQDKAIAADTEYRKKHNIPAPERQEPTRRSARIRGIKTDVKLELDDPDVGHLTTRSMTHPRTQTHTKEFIPPLGVSVELENSGESENKVQYFKIIAKQLTEENEISSSSKNHKKDDTVIYSEADRFTAQNEKEEIDTLKGIFSDMEIRHEEANIPIAESRIYSLAFHPNVNTESLLVCAGDKYGTLGFWKLGSSDFRIQDWNPSSSRKSTKRASPRKIKKENKDYIDETKSKTEGSPKKKVDIYEESAEPDLFSFKPHTEAISSIVIPTQSPNNVYTSAYDGTIRVLDLEQPNSFNQIMKLEADHMITSMDLQFSHGVHPLVWFTTTIGIAGFTDSREHNSTVYSHMFHNSRVHCVSPNPKNSNVVATSSLDKSFRIWDIRNMLVPLETQITTYQKARSKKKTSLNGATAASVVDDASYIPVEIDILREGGCVTSAYFSPDGERIVSTSFNDIVALWSWDQQNLKVTDKQFTRHNNRTGRWLSMFRSRWHPNIDFPSCFVVGNMDQSIDIYSGHSLSPVANLEDRKRINTVPAVAIFHPNLPVIASGNASGKISIWS